MSERWLNELTKIIGVEGVLVVASNGRIIENVRSQFDQVILEELSRYVLRMIAANQLSDAEVKELELVWSDYNILAISHDTFVIIILCTSAKVLSLLRITMNVVAAHLIEDRKISKKIKKFGRDNKNLLDQNHLDESEINLISKLQ